jgi:hypothetical protein
VEVQIGQPRSAAWTPRHHPLRSGWSRDPHSSPPSRSLPPPPIVVLAGDGLTISSDPADSVVRVPAMLSPLVAVAHIVQGTSARSVRRGWRWRARFGGYQLPSDASHQPGPGRVRCRPPPGSWGRIAHAASSVVALGLRGRPERSNSLYAEPNEDSLRTERQWRSCVCLG